METVISRASPTPPVKLCNWLTTPMVFSLPCRNPAARISGYDYDPIGRLITTIDPTNATTTLPAPANYDITPSP